MAALDGIQVPYLVTLNIYLSEHINIYNKAVFGIP